METRTYGNYAGRRDDVQGQSADPAWEACHADFLHCYGDNNVWMLIHDTARWPYPYLLCGIDLDKGKPCA